MSDDNLNYQRTRIEHTRKKFDLLDLPPLDGKSYLDLGCNSGMFCRFAVDAGAADVFGIDIDPKLIALAEEFVPEAGFLTSRFENIELEGRQFDYVSIASAIHYSQDFVTVANKIMGLVKDDGMLVIEGGLFDPAGNSTLNAPVPGWRKIGDHCRQLTMGLVTDVLFPNCDVKLSGPSLNQGGDNLARYVLHIRKPQNQPYQPSQKTVAKLDLEAFIRSLAVSFDTINEKYPMYKHMEGIKLAALMGPGKYAEYLNSTDVVAALAKEINFCTSDWATSVEIVDTYKSQLGKDIAIALQQT